MHQGMMTGDDGEQDTAKDVLWLRMSSRLRQETEKNVGDPCAGCGGLHECRLCRFHGAQRRECGKIRHILKVCRSWRQLSPCCKAKAEDRTDFKATCTNTPYCDNLAVTAINEVSKHSMKKIHVSVRLKGVQCQLKVDSGPTFSIIPDATARHMFPKGYVQKLQPLIRKTVRPCRWSQQTSLSAPVPI